MKPVVPSLGKAGWVVSPEGIAEKIFGYFLAANASQDPLIPQEVVSYMKIMQSNAGDIQGTMRALENALTKLFGNYFEIVSVVCEDRTDPAQPSYGKIGIYVQFTDDKNQQHSLGQILTVRNGVIEAFDKISN